PTTLSARTMSGLSGGRGGSGPSAARDGGCEPSWMISRRVQNPLSPRSDRHYRVLIKNSRHGNNLQLHPSILRPPGFGVIGSDRLIRTHALSDDSSLLNSPGSQIVGDAGRAAVGQVVVVVSTARGVGVPAHLQSGVVVLGQYLCHGVQGAVELWANGVFVGVESDVAWHDQIEEIAITLHLHSGALRLL